MKTERYQAYKDSEVEWIGEVPKHWEVRHFKQFSTMKGRIGWQGLKHSEFIDEGPFLITGMNFKDGKIRWDEVYHITNERYEQAPEIQLKENDILITKDGTIGKLLYVDKIPAPHKASLNSHLLVFRPIRKSYYPRYLYYQLGASVFQDYVEVAKTGTTFFGISQAAVGRYIGIIPPLTEQKAIAHYLDTKTAQIDRKIDLLTQKATLYGNLKQSLINETVTRGLDKTVLMKDSGIEWIGEVPEHWKISRIKNLGVLSRGVDLPRDDFVEGIFPVYGSNGIIGYHSNYTTKAPCLTVGRSGSVGEVNYVSENFWAHNTTLYLQQSFNNNIKFIFYLFKSLNLQSFSAGSAVGTLNRNIIHQLRIAIPPVSEQKEIADYLDTKTAQIDQIIQTINTQIEKLKELRKTLINDVVTGKIRVIDNE